MTLGLFLSCIGSQDPDNRIAVGFCGEAVSTAEQIRTRSLEETEMNAAHDHTPLLTGPDVDALARRFLDSSYADDGYSNWSLDRRLEGFLRNLGLSHLADDGDTASMLINRVMSYIAGLRQPGQQLP